LPGNPGKKVSIDAYLSSRARRSHRLGGLEDGFLIAQADSHPMLRSGLRCVGERVRQLREQTAAQDLIEYAVLIALIATTVLVAVSGLGLKVPGFYEATEAAMPGEAPAGDPGSPPNGNPGNDKPVGDAGDDPGQGKGQ
jgi:Flp pilus assembly pilin Flp